MSDSSATNSVRYGVGAALIAITVLALIARGWNIGESFWVDELHTAWCAAGSLAEVAPRAEFGNQSPLFFYLEWFLAQAFGLSEVALRAPSVFAGVMLCPAMFLLVLRWTRQPLAALAAALLAAWDNNLILYAGEARPYALVQLMAVLHLLALTQLLDAWRSSGGRAGEASAPPWLPHLALVATGWLAFHLHYTAGLLFVADAAALGLLAALDARLRSRWMEMAGDLAALALGALMSLGHLLEIFARRDNWSTFIEPPRWWEMAERMQLGLYLGGTLALVAFAYLLRRPSSNSGDPAEVSPAWQGLTLAGCWLAAPLLLTYALSAGDVARVFYFRYLLAMFPAPIALAVTVAALTPGDVARRFVLAGVVGVCMLGGTTAWMLGTEGRFTYLRDEDWRGVIPVLEEHRSAGAPVLLFSNLIETAALTDPPEEHPPLLREYALLPLQSAYPTPIDASDLIPLPAGTTPTLSTAELQSIAAAGEAWLIVRADEATAETIGYAIAQQLAAIDQEYGVAGEQRFGGVKVMQLGRLEADPATDSPSALDP